MSDNKQPDSKTPLTGFSGRESVFDQRLRDIRSTGQFQKPDRKTLQFLKKTSTEFQTPSMDSRIIPSVSESDEYTETERVAFIDEASGLMNARTIMGKLALEMRRSARYKHHFSAIILELDRGALEGSATALQIELTFTNFCKLVSKNIREVDKLGRFDEFSLLLVCPETGMAEAAVEAERLREIVAKAPLKQVGQHIPITVSIGIAAYPEHGDAPFDVLGSALQCAQQAVASGGNTVCCAGSLQQELAVEDFSPEFDARPTDRESFLQTDSKMIDGMVFPTTTDISSIKS